MRTQLAITCVVALTIVTLTACAGGGGGGSGGGVPPAAVNGTASTVTVTSLPANKFQVDFGLQADTNKALGATIDYSEDLGATFQVATLDGGGGSYQGSPAGTSNQVTWDSAADLGVLNQQDLMILISPYNLDNSNPGTPSTSTAFGIGAGAAPSIIALPTPAGEVGGWVTFNYTVQDPESDFVTLSGRYSTNGGATYQTATLGGGDGTTAISTSVGGVAHTIQWQAQGDASETFDSNVRLELTATDVNPGTSLATGDFSIRTYAPRVDLLTVNKIPSSMNGSTTFTNLSGDPQAFSVVTPTSGFVVWFEFSVHFLGAAINTRSLTIYNSRDLGGGSGSGGVDANSDFSGLMNVNLGSGLADLTITSALDFPTGSNTLSAQLVDTLGNESTVDNFAFTTAATTNSKIPFENTDHWYLRFDRDNFTINSTTSGGGVVTVTSTQVANAVEDFVEDLRILGLNSASPPAAAVTAGLNGIVYNLVTDSVRGHLSTHFQRNFDGSGTADSANVNFVLASQAGTLSQISIGGDDPSPGFTLGRAFFDYKNDFANVNTATNLGIFTTNLIAFYINSSATFKSKFDALIPGRGTALGFHADDVAVLSPGFDRANIGNTASENNRYDDIMDSVDAMGRSVSVILAHEVGHSVGLVANGAPPTGIFGNESNASFSGPYTNLYHLDTTGNNIMQASISFSDTVATGASGPFFGELIMAYLQQRTLTQ
jgi:hypothetical protein